MASETALSLFLSASGIWVGFVFGTWKETFDLEQSRNP